MDILDNNEPIERRPKRLGLIESNLLNVSELFKNSENSKTNPQDIIDDLKLISSDDNFDERLEEEIKETQEKMKLQINQYINWTSWEKGFPWDEEIEKVNHDVFHNYSFKNWQREIINAVKAKRDTIALIPTGHGKSLTFQLPAVMDQGVSIIIMPLLSLIEDQVQKLKVLNIEAVFIHSSNDMSEILKSLKNRSQKAKLFFVTPEQLMNNEALQSVLSELYKRNEIERFVIDEIHWMLNWGKDFRLDYLKLISIRTMYPDVPILGLTATATAEMEKELKQKLILRDPLTFSISFNRSNLYYKVVHMKMKERRDALCDMLLKEFNNMSGIVYTSTIKEWEELSKHLKFNMNINCSFYHGKMEIEKRNEIQNKWKNDEISIIVATIAFGMGIDK